MRASKIVAGALSVAIVGGALVSFTQGLAVPPPTSSFCKNTELSFPDQNRCTQDMKSATTDEMRNNVVAHYQGIISAALSPQQDSSPQQNAAAPSATDPAPSPSPSQQDAATPSANSPN